ncbi:MFS transporter [Serratia fonticola]|uniref:MFS transporter n=1 Tax=Serratia fonticola TaxID=47917 RepID=UPI001AE68C24|nr:MFS transporter [Serratia fonticola]MBP1038411.1 MFS transporter [Serratia fonticola]
MSDRKDQQARVLLATSLSYVIVILDTSIVNVALEPISASFQTGVSGLQWVVNAYTLTFACLLLTGGTLGDRMGAKRIYLAGLLVFSAASALCGLAPTLMVLVIARVLQGIGAAMLVPCSLTLINGAYTNTDERASAIGKWAGFGGIAMAAGPLVGGVLIHLLGWRSIFLVNVPLALLGAWLTTRIRSEEVAIHSTRHLDGAGQMLAIVALASSVAVLIESAELGWSSRWIAAGVLGSTVAWALFVVTEAKSREPMLPLRFFKSAVFSTAALVSMISALVFYGLFFLLSLYFQTIRGWGALQTGLAFLPLTVFVTIGSFLSGALGKRYGSLRLVAGGSRGSKGRHKLGHQHCYRTFTACSPVLDSGARMACTGTSIHGVIVANSMERVRGLKEVLESETSFSACCTRNCIRRNEGSSRCTPVQSTNL